MKITNSIEPYQYDEWPIDGHWPWVIALALALAVVGMSYGIFILANGV